MAKDETVEELLARWNTPATSHALDRMVGQPVPEGDTRATASVPDERLVGSLSGDGVDAQRQSPYDDDGDDGDAFDYEEATNDQLRDELERRGLPKSGNKEELIARLTEDDESDDDDEDDEDEDS